MNKEKFEELLKQNENYFLDFKSEMYFSNSSKDKNKARAEFVKDILSMWNTPRETDAYIVLGVTKNTDNSYKLNGIDKNIPDDADLRSKFEALVNNTPNFYIDILDYENKIFVIITIPIATIISKILKDFSEQTLKKDALYYREGSKNTEVVKGSDKEKEIYKWFRDKEAVDGFSTYSSNERLLSAMENFDSDKYFYFLITSQLNDSTLPLKNFGLITVFSIYVSYI